MLLVQTAGGVPIDIALGGIAFEARCVNRATVFDFGSAQLVTCSAADLVVLKAFAGRGHAWTDIESIAIRRAAPLDWRLAYDELAPLVAVQGRAEAIERLQRLQHRQ